MRTSARKRISSVRRQSHKCKHEYERTAQDRLSLHNLLFLKTLRRRSRPRRAQEEGSKKLSSLPLSVQCSVSWVLILARLRGRHCRLRCCSDPDGEYTHVQETGSRRHPGAITEGHAAKACKKALPAMIKTRTSTTSSKTARGFQDRAGQTRPRPSDMPPHAEAPPSCTHQFTKPCIPKGKRGDSTSVREPSMRDTTSRPKSQKDMQSHRQNNASKCEASDRDSCVYVIIDTLTS